MNERLTRNEAFAILDMLNALDYEFGDGTTQRVELSKDESRRVDDGIETLVRAIENSFPDLILRYKEGQS